MLAVDNPKDLDDRIVNVRELVSSRIARKNDRINKVIAIQKDKA